MVIFLIHPLNCAAQTDNVTVPDNDPGQPDLSPHSLYAGLGYGNNMIYLGSTISQNQPYAYTTLTYGYRDMLYISLAPDHLAERNPFIAFNMTSVSFSHVFNSWFDISAASSYYHVAPSLRETLFGNYLYTDVTFGFDWKILDSKLSAGGMFSDQKLKIFPDSWVHFKRSLLCLRPLCEPDMWLPDHNGNRHRITCSDISSFLEKRQEQPAFDKY